MPKAPTTQRTPTEAAADRVERLTTDPDLTEPMNVPADPGDGAPALSQPGAQADPTLALATDASAETHPQERDRAGAGRPISPAGRRLAGLGIPAAQYLQVLGRIAHGRTQRRLRYYLHDARALGATDDEARLVLAAVEHMIVVAQPIGHLDPFDVAAEIVGHQFGRGEVAS